MHSTLKALAILIPGVGIGLFLGAYLWQHDHAQNQQPMAHYQARSAQNLIEIIQTKKHSKAKPKTISAFDLAEAYYNAAWAYYLEKNYEQAIANFDKAIAIYPRHHAAYSVRGTIKYNSEDYEAALKDYDRAISLQPEDDTYYRNRALTHQKNGTPAAALKDYDRAIALNPNKAEYYQGRAALKNTLGDVLNSEKDYAQAQTLLHQEGSENKPPQARCKANSEATKTLTWDDFKGTPPAENDYTAYTYWDVFYTYSVDLSQDTVACRFEVWRCFDHEKSWVRKGRNDDYSRLLKHEQGHYDIAQIFVKELHKTFASTTYSAKNYDQEIQTIFGTLLQKYRTIEKRYDRETEHYAHRENQNAWNEYFQKELNP